MIDSMDKRPVGVFDSGLGGLTAVRELRRLLPEEDIVYFGDTGRVPYGTKGHDTIVKYALQDVRFLMGYDVKMIVIACGTVSSTAFREAAGAATPVPVIGVLEAAARAAAERTRDGRIGVLGTSATVRSGSFERELRHLLPEASITGRACPLFVPLVENGYFARENPVASLVAHDYLDSLRGQVDTLILGCTHYPLLYDLIARIMGSEVALVDAGRETAVRTAGILREKQLLCGSTAPGRCRFFVSDSTEDFSRLAGLFLGTSIESLEKVDIDRY